MNQSYFLKDSLRIEAGILSSDGEIYYLAANIQPEPTDTTEKNRVLRKFKSTLQFLNDQCLIEEVFVTLSSDADEMTWFGISDGGISGLYSNAISST